MNWSQQDTASVLSELDSRAVVSTKLHACERLEPYGPNGLEERGARSPLSVVVDRLTEVMVVGLLLGTVCLADEHCGQPLRAGVWQMMSFTALGPAQIRDALKAIPSARARKGM